MILDRPEVENEAQDPLLSAKVWRWLFRIQLVLHLTLFVVGLGGTKEPAYILGLVIGFLILYCFFIPLGLSIAGSAVLLLLRGVLGIIQEKRAVQAIQRLENQLTFKMAQVGFQTIITLGILFRLIRGLVLVG